VVLLAVLGCAGAVAAQESAPRQRKQPLSRPADPRRIALLVGVQHYAPGTDTDRFPLLRGPDNDVSLMRDVLQDRLGFDAGSILVLRDGDATLRGIVTGFQHWMIESARADSEVLFYFSGHGAQVPDQSGREENGLDSSLLAFDSRVGDRDGNYDLTDDAMQGLLQALGRVTGRITVISDACFSGSGLRGTALGVRSAPAGRRGLDTARLAEFWPAGAPILDDDDPRRGNIDRRYVHISACSNRQYAREWQPAGGAAADGPPRVYGAFTWFLARALSEALPGASHRAVAEQTQILVSNHVPG